MPKSCKAEAPDLLQDGAGAIYVAAILTPIDICY